MQANMPAHFYSVYGTCFHTPRVGGMYDRFDRCQRDAEIVPRSRWRTFAANGRCAACFGSGPREPEPHPGRGVPGLIGPESSRSKIDVCGNVHAEQLAVWIGF